MLGLAGVIVIEKACSPEVPDAVDLRGGTG
jgi:hypothetical protein